MSPDGRTIYTNNRAPEHSLSIFAVGASGLDRIGDQGAGGTTPRGFALSPDGRFVLVANGGTGQVVLFERDLNGALRQRGDGMDVPGAASVVWYP